LTERKKKKKKRAWQKGRNGDERTRFSLLNRGFVRKIFRKKALESQKKKKGSKQREAKKNPSREGGQEKGFSPNYLKGSGADCGGGVTQRNPSKVPNRPQGEEEKGLDKTPSLSLPKPGGGKGKRNRIKQWWRGEHLSRGSIQKKRKEILASL